MSSPTNLGPTGSSVPLPAEPSAPRSVPTSAKGGAKAFEELVDEDLAAAGGSATAAAVPPDEDLAEVERKRQSVHQGPAGRKRGRAEVGEVDRDADLVDRMLFGEKQDAAHALANAAAVLETAAPDATKSPAEAPASGRLPVEMLQQIVRSARILASRHEPARMTVELESRVLGGKVSLDLSVDERVVSLSFVSPSAAVAEVLANAMPDLADCLRDAGLQLDRSSVEVGASSGGGQGQRRSGEPFALGPSTGAGAADGSPGADEQPTSRAPAPETSTDYSV
ncbi:MAG: flagellar hook-length control protein FliK [Candidatus Schekmanbacteria bacterium]|nr:flagellar hook-length control protein FliK [Candidatus Schekmanbacteria bacterium]